MVFFFAALAEVLITVLSVLNLPRQGLPLVQLSTVVFAGRCFLPQKYFAIRQRTINIGWIKSRWPFCLDTKTIERFMTKGKSQLACDPRVIRALRERQNYTLAPRELLFNLLFPYFIVCSRDHSSICDGRSRQLKNAYIYICPPFPYNCLTSVCISTSVWKPVTNLQLLVCKQLSPQWGRCWGS